MNKPEHVVLYGADWCADCRRLKYIMDKHNVAYDYKNTDEESNKTKMLALNGNETIIRQSWSAARF